MVEIVNHGASPKFVATVTQLWADTPAPLVRLFDERGWHVETHHHVYTTGTLAYVRPKDKTLAYIERIKLLPLFPRYRSPHSTSKHTHYHELGHFLDYNVEDKCNSKSLEFQERAFHTDLPAMPSDLWAKVMLFLDSAASQGPGCVGAELFAELFADNMIGTANMVSKAFPAASAFVWQQMRPLVYDR